MILEHSKCRLEIVSETDYQKGSADQKSAYDEVYDNERGYQFASQFGIRLYQDDSLVKSALIRSTGGSSVMNENAVVLREDSLTLCCGSSLFNLSIPDLTLNWLTRADWATCFQVFSHEDDFIVHGELFISRVSKDGHLIWQNSGEDIFVNLDGLNEFWIDDSGIGARDWNGRIYKFDFDGNEVT